MALSRAVPVLPIDGAMPTSFNIAAGEELTVDYALFTVQPGWRLDGPYRCGALACCRKLTGEDWRLSEVQGRYYPRYSPFINRRIDRLSNRKS